MSTGNLQEEEEAIEKEKDQINIARKKDSNWNANEQEEKTRFFFRVEDLRLYLKDLFGHTYLEKIIIFKIRAGA